jgi:hypothetical protein
LSTRRKELPQFKKRQYNSLKRKDWVSSSLTGRMTFLVELSATLNTQDAFVASLLRCIGKFGKPFLTSVELLKRYFPVRRLHSWY